jgi:dTMP kinase
MLITFEGPEGSGKTTQVQALHDYLRGRGYDVLVTREPGGTPIGDQIRRILLDPENREMLPEAEILLFSASRAQLVGQVIRPALQRGSIVLCDRFADSTLAYQGYGRGLDLDRLRLITEFATGGLEPDLTIYLDLDVEEGLRRKRLAGAAGQESWNRLDRQELEFHQRVRRGYLELAATHAERWFVVDASRPADVVQEEIRRRVDALLEERGVLPKG